MTSDHLTDPLSDALATLPALAPRRSHDARVRARCHALLASRQASLAPDRWKPSDVVLAASAALYVVVAITEALSLLRAWSG